jgi:hypothetical protein
VIYRARRPALPAPKQDPDPESGPDQESEPKLSLKSDPNSESDPKKIIPDPHPAGISEESLLQLQVVTQDLKRVL